MTADLPRVRIERTPANDVYLLLTGLGLDGEAQQVLADPLAYARSHQAEAKAVVRLLQGRLSAFGDGGGTGGRPAPERAAPDRASPPRPSPPRRDEAGRPLRTGSSLLR